MQLRDYINSNFTAKIRSSSKKLSSLQKVATVKRLYEKLNRGMTGLEFIEVIYNKNFEEFLMNTNHSEDGSASHLIADDRLTQCML